MPKSYLPKLKQAGLSFASTSEKGEPFVSSASVPLVDGIALCVTISETAELYLTVERVGEVDPSDIDRIQYLTSARAEIAPADKFRESSKESYFRASFNLMVMEGSGSDMAAITDVTLDKLFIANVIVETMREIQSLHIKDLIEKKNAFVKHLDDEHERNKQTVLTTIETLCVQISGNGKEIIDAALAHVESTGEAFNLEIKVYKGTTIESYALTFATNRKIRLLGGSTVITQKSAAAMIDTHYIKKETAKLLKLNENAE